jgi:plasmid stabilization system protein ParE
MGQKEKAATETNQVRILDKAFHDINQIADFIANNNQQPFNAVKVTEAIFETINKIGQNPLAFRECEQLPTKTKIYRRAICLSWIIIYKITKPGILILSVTHGSRNPSKIKNLRKMK